MTEGLSCEVCGAARLKSHYRCMKCKRWLCVKCYAPEVRMCPPCAEANLDPHAEQRADFDDDVMSDLLKPRSWEQ